MNCCKFLIETKMLISNVLYFFLGFAVMWLASKLVITGIQRFAKDIKISAFAASFLILGVLTSLTEISVGLNSILDKKPAIFVGNLIGGSFVIVLLIIPLLSLFGKGVSFKHRLDEKRLIFFLVLIFSPSLVALDGYLSANDGWLLLILYALFFHLFQSQQRVLDHLDLTGPASGSAAKDILRVVAGAVLIYLSGKILVSETIFFSDFLKVPPLLVSLLVLSVGTNLPEMLIALRSIQRRHSEIALGDFIGSAATNALLFGIFTLINGPFALETKGFSPIFFIILFGYVLFYFFARTQTRLSPAKAVILLLAYLIFLLFQTTEIVSLSPAI